MNALYIIPILAILILIHEIGHFVTARLVGIKVHEFGLGIPPRLFGITRGGVLYSINAIPLGGFVRVLGEDGKASDPDSMQSKTKLQRTAFITAGSAMNLLLAVVLITVMVAVQGETTSNVYIAEVEQDSPAAAAGWQTGDRLIGVEGNEITSVEMMVSATERNTGTPMQVTLMRGDEIVESEIVPRTDPPPGQGPTGISLTTAALATIAVAEVEPGSPADEAGLAEGDVIESVDDQPILDGASYFLALQNNAGETVPVTIKRGGESLTIDLTLPTAANQTDAETGLVISQDVIFHGVPWWQVIPRGIAETFNTLARMFEALQMLFRGEAPLGGIAGPIGMGQLTSEVLEVSAAPQWITLVNIMVLLSLNLAILNLLPLPALDGGRMLFVIIEAVRGRRVAPEKEGVIHFVGLVVLLGVMFVVAFIDIDRLISGQSLLP